jgi:hypothetical protein
MKSDSKEGGTVIGYPSQPDCEFGETGQTQLDIDVFDLGVAPNQRPFIRIIGRKLMIPLYRFRGFRVDFSCFERPVFCLDDDMYVFDFVLVHHCTRS